MGKIHCPGNLFTGLNYKSFLGRIFILEMCLVRCCIWPQTAGLFNHLVSFTSIATYLIHCVYLTTYLQWKRRNNIHTYIYIYVSVCISMFLELYIIIHIYIYKYAHKKTYNAWGDYSFSSYNKENTRTELTQVTGDTEISRARRVPMLIKHLFSDFALNSWMESMLHKGWGQEWVWVIWFDFPQ